MIESAGEMVLSALLLYKMMQGSKAHFVQLAAANVGWGPAKHEQIAT